MAESESVSLVATEEQSAPVEEMTSKEPTVDATPASIEEKSVPVRLPSQARYLLKE